MLWETLSIISMPYLCCSFSDGSGCWRADTWLLGQISRNVSADWCYSGLQLQTKQISEFAAMQISAWY